jgi:O-antigen ligase
VLSLALVLATIGTVLISQHETSALALAFGALAFAIAIASRRLAFAVVVTGWVAAFILVLPLAHYAYSGLNLQRATWLPFSAQARIVIWKYTASQIPQARFLGVGAGSTEPLDQKRGEVVTIPGDPIALRTARHSHNIFLQTWYELGGIGAFLLLSAGLVVIGAIQNMRVPVQPYGLAAFATMAAMSASSWSLWQEWFLSTVALSAVICMFLDWYVGQPDEPIPHAASGRSQTL